jgi:hypothetical protein
MSLKRGESGGRRRRWPELDGRIPEPVQEGQGFTPLCLLLFGIWPGLNLSNLALGGLFLCFGGDLHLQLAEHLDKLVPAAGYQVDKSDPDLIFAIRPFDRAAEAEGNSARFESRLDAEPAAGGNMFPGAHLAAAEAQFDDPALHSVAAADELEGGLLVQSAPGHHPALSTLRRQAILGHLVFHGLLRPRN